MSHEQLQKPNHYLKKVVLGASAAVVVGGLLMLREQFKQDEINRRKLTNPQYEGIQALDDGDTTLPFIEYLRSKENEAGD